MFTLYRYSRFLVCYTSPKNGIQFSSFVRSLHALGISLERNSIPIKEWDDKLNELITINGQKTAYYIIKACYKKKNISLAKSFLEYIEQNHKAVLPVTNAIYLCMLTINKEDKELFLELHKKLSTEYKSDKKVCMAVDNSVKYAWFKVGEPSFEEIVGNKGLLAAIEFYKDRNIPKLVVNNMDPIISTLGADRNTVRSKAVLRVLLQHLSTMKVPLKPWAYSGITEFLEKNKIKYCKVKMLNSVPCPNCIKSLSVPEKPNMNDIEILKNAVEGEIVKGQNIYFKTTPQEWKSFKQFLAKNGKFDVVIDGLNFTHDLNNFNKKHLKKDMDKLGSKFLYIGRQHQSGAIEKCAKSVNDNYKTFYPGRDSADDLFVIYAALWSGINTKYISNDFMRQHTDFSCLDMQDLFFRWQKYHQIIVEDYRLKDSSLYAHVPHYDGENTFHITPERIQRLGPETSWLCINLKSYF